MGIANELSSEVVAAVFAREARSARAETEELVEIVRDFHSAVRDLVSEERRRRVSQLPGAEPLSRASGQAASGSH
jgi:hypothetical protein